MSLRDIREKLVSSRAATATPATVATLADLRETARKRPDAVFAGFATATPATVATLEAHPESPKTEPEANKQRTVAEVAGVAVAEWLETASRTEDFSHFSQISLSQGAQYDENPESDPAERIEAIESCQPATSHCKNCSKSSWCSCSRGTKNDDPAARIEEWLRGRPIPRKERSLWKRLVKATEDFALGPWAVPAIEAGWNDCALYSMPLGLIPEQLRRTLIVTGIDASAATCMNARGKFERFRCMNLDHPPWWNDPRFIPSKPVEREWHSTRGHERLRRKHPRSSRGRRNAGLASSSIKAGAMARAAPRSDYGALRRSSSS